MNAIPRNIPGAATDRSIGADYIAMEGEVRLLAALCDALQRLIFTDLDEPGGALEEHDQTHFELALAARDITQRLRDLY